MKNKMEKWIILLGSFALGLTIGALLVLIGLPANAEKMPVQTGSIPICGNFFCPQFLNGNKTPFALLNYCDDIKP